MIRLSIACLGLGAVSAGAAILTAIQLRGEWFSTYAASASIAFGLLLFLMSRAFKSRERT